MKKLMIVAGAAALLAASSLTVLAAEATGMISSVDATGGTVTLDDGKVYRLPTTVAFADFKVGQKVMITFDAQPAGALMASAILLAPAAGAPAAAGSATPAPGTPSSSGGNAGPANNPGAPRD